MDHPLLDVGLEHAKRLLVTLHRHAERVGKPLGREEVDDDPLRELDRFGGGAANLLVEAEVDDQLFGGAGHAAEIGIRGDDVGFVDRHLHLFGGGGTLRLGFFGHEGLQKRASMTPAKFPQARKTCGPPGID